MTDVYIGTLSPLVSDESSLQAYVCNSMWKHNVIQSGMLLILRAIA